MEIKKSPKADLEGRKLLFRELGLIVALLVVLAAFEWSTAEKTVSTMEAETAVVAEEEIVPITQEEVPPPPEAPGPLPPAAEAAFHPRALKTSD